MSKKKAKSAELIIKLYELRRDEAMRNARNWFATFFPESKDDIVAAAMHPDSSASYRMVTSYWDMATSFVNHGAIDEELFMESAGEAVMNFAKIQPFLEELRALMGNPGYLKNYEKLIMKQPEIEQRLVSSREYMKGMVAKRAEMAKSAS
jgi:hypothetical protein